MKETCEEVKRIQRQIEFLKRVNNNVKKNIFYVIYKVYKIEEIYENFSQEKLIIWSVMDIESNFIVSCL